MLNMRMSGEIKLVFLWRSWLETCCSGPKVALVAIVDCVPYSTTACRAAAHDSRCTGTFVITSAALLRGGCAKL